MSIIDKWAEKLVDRSDNLGEDGVEALAKAARKELPEGDDGESTAIREAGEYALVKLEKHKERIGEMTKEQLASFLTWVGIGNHKRAVHSLPGIDPATNWADALNAVANAGDDTEQAKRDYDAAVAFVKDVGSLAATKLLPLVLAVV